MARAGRILRLTDAGVARLRPETREYVVRDSRTPCLGVRVRPSEARSFVHRGGPEHGSRRTTLGPAAFMTVEEARRRCLELEAAAPAAGAASPVPSFEAFVAGEWASACLPRLKASTRRGADIVLKRRLLPAFGGPPLDAIGPEAVRRWFDDYSKDAPGGANRALAFLRQMLGHAAACGHLEKNPTRGIKLNPRPRLARFLSKEEILRLGRALEECEAGRPGRREQAEAIRLLLATGCRKSEITNLRWSEVRGDALELADGKTGPRRVLLSAQALRILGRRPRPGGPWVFPGLADPALRRELPLWRAVRRKAGLEDVRLHDLRHTFASHAVLQGVPLPVVARLLGHKSVSMTLRYAHIADRDVEAAAERIGLALDNALENRPVPEPSKSNGQRPRSVVEAC